METRRNNNSFTGILLVLFVAWLLFGNGIQVVLLLTQQAQQRLAQQHAPLVIAVPTAQVTQPPAAANVQAQPLQPGQLAPLTLDGSAPAESAPAQPLPTSWIVDAQPLPTAAPIQAQAQPQPAVIQEQPAPTRTPEPTREPTSAPVVAEATAMPINARGEPDWNALAAEALTAQPAQPTAVQIASAPSDAEICANGCGTGGGSGGSWGN